MMTGLNMDLRDIDGPRKTAVISSELARLNVDIAALQETRLADYGSFREKEKSTHSSGRVRAWRIAGSKVLALPSGTGSFQWWSLATISQSESCT